MAIPKKYLHDKVVLLLVSTNVFLAFLCTVLILLRLSSGQGGDGYIVQYRANLGISAFKTDGITSILGFILFAVVSTAINVGLSIRAYHLRRELSLTILSLGGLLLLLTLIVSNALLVLR